MITLCTALDCRPCLATMRALDRAWLEYREVDMLRDAEAMERVKALGYRQAPVVVERAGQEAWHWNGLPHCGSSDFISHKVTLGEQPICSAHGWNVVVQP